jgi:hypothetical protein
MSGSSRDTARHVSETEAGKKLPFANEKMHAVGSSSGCSVSRHPIRRAPSMKKLFETMFILLVLTCAPLFSQTAIERQPIRTYSRNCLYLELLGTGILYSVNLEHRFARHWSGRVGFTTFSVSDAVFAEPELSTNFLGFPVLMTYLAGSRSHFLEMGAGVLVLNVSVDGRDIWFGMDVNGQMTAVLGAAAIGYRYQPANGGFLFRIGLTPLTSFSSSIVLVGMSLGAAF